MRWYLKFHVLTYFSGFELPKRYEKLNTSAIIQHLRKCKWGLWNIYFKNINYIDLVIQEILSVLKNIVIALTPSCWFCSSDARHHLVNQPRQLIKACFGSNDLKESLEGHFQTILDAEFCNKKTKVTEVEIMIII